MASQRLHTSFHYCESRNVWIYAANFAGYLEELLTLIPPTVNKIYFLLSALLFGSNVYYL